MAISFQLKVKMFNTKLWDKSVRLFYFGSSTSS